MGDNTRFSIHQGVGGMTDRWMSLREGPVTTLLLTFLSNNSSILPIFARSAEQDSEIGDYWGVTL